MVWTTKAGANCAESLDVLHRDLRISLARFATSSGDRLKSNCHPALTVCNRGHSLFQKI